MKAKNATPELLIVKYLLYLLNVPRMEDQKMGGYGGIFATTRSILIILRASMTLQIESMSIHALTHSLTAHFKTAESRQTAIIVR